MSLLLPVLLIAAVLLWLLSPARGARHPGHSAELDQIDPDELESAENEVRDLGSQQTPEAGFERDDWGPGAGHRR